MITANQCPLCFKSVDTNACSNCLHSSLSGLLLYSITGSYSTESGETYYFDERIWHESQWEALNLLYKQISEKQANQAWYWRSAVINLVNVTTQK